MTDIFYYYMPMCLHHTLNILLDFTVTKRRKLMKRGWGRPIKKGRSLANRYFDARNESNLALIVIFLYHSFITCHQRLKNKRIFIYLFLRWSATSAVEQTRIKMNTSGSVCARKKNTWRDSRGLQWDDKKLPTVFFSRLLFNWYLVSPFFN